MAETVNSVTLELLAWVSSGRRTYGEVMAAWRSTCPRHPVWENAVAEGLVRVAHGATQAQAEVTLTPRGQAVLEGNDIQGSGEGKMRTLKIALGYFMHEFEREGDASDYLLYLDLNTGDLHRVYEDDETAKFNSPVGAEENAELRRLVEARPDEYLEIPGSEHGEHHDVLHDFLNSRWTNDDEARRRARDAYSGSIGRWKRAVPRNVVHAYYDFCDRQMQRRAEEFLREHGIVPEWE